MVPKKAMERVLYMKMREDICYKTKYGCYNCKSMKKKCDEYKPKCGYCSRTGRSCVYPFWVTLSNNREDHVSSLICQLKPTVRITQLQRKLFNYFVSIAAARFGQGINPQLDQLWAQEIPRLFIKHPCIREAIYAYSSLYLWINFDKLSGYNNSNDESRIALQAEFERTFSKLLKHLLSHSFATNRDSNKALLASNVLLLYCILLYPSLDMELISFGKPAGTLDVMTLARSQRNVINLLETQLFDDEIRMLYDTDSLLVSYEKKTYHIMLIDYIRGYVNTHTTSPLREVYLSTLKSLEVALFRCIQFSSPIPLTRLLLEYKFISTEFEESLKKGDYVAAKILFYYSAFCQVICFSWTPPISLWQKYMENYAQNWKNMDVIDDWLLETVIKLHVQFPHDQLHHIQNYGSEVLGAPDRMSITYIR